MIVRDNAGKVVGQLEHFRDNKGNIFDTNTMKSSAPVPPRPAGCIQTTPLAELCDVPSSSLLSSDRS